MEFERLIDIVSEVMGAEREEIRMETSFVDDLGADSLELGQIIMGIEQEFDIVIEDEDYGRIATVSDAWDAIKNAAERQGS
ncbi:MAG: acyl carrier protein [Lachnospiraceae bacterium]|nr:acyl carrier protein [Lachnospiraceae bacterium]